MADNITTRRAPGLWVVRAGGAVLGESERALELTEAGKAPVIYFPREDLAMAFLEPSGKTSHSPLGEATLYSVAARSGPIPDAAWSYESPAPGMEEITGHLAFHPGDRVQVEQL